MDSFPGSKGAVVPPSSDSHAKWFSSTRLLGKSAGSFLVWEVLHMRHLTQCPDPLGAAELQLAGYVLQGVDLVWAAVCKLQG